MELKVRGLAFVYTRNFLKEKLGEKKFKEFVSSLPENLRNFMGKEIYENEQYPFAYFAEINREIYEKIANRNPEFLRKMGEYTIRMGAETGPFRILFETPDLKTYITQIGAFTFSHYYNFGKFVVKEFAPENKRIVICLEDIPFEDEFFEERICGAIKAGVEIKNLKNVKVEITKRRSKGDECIEYVITWE